MFSFRALDDHIAAGGTITVSMGAWGIDGEHRLTLEMIAHEAGQGLEGSLPHRGISAFTRFGWSEMASVFTCELVYESIEQYRRC
jgi:hypothetical protein